MSNEYLVKVNCYHSGHFKTENTTKFVEGVVDVLKVDAHSIFTDVVLKMLEKRIDIGNMWYKLPFEDVEDKKPLFLDVDMNKKKMQAAGRWLKELGMYIEKTEIVAENVSDKVAAELAFGKESAEDAAGKESAEDDVGKEFAEDEVLQGFAAENVRKETCAEESLSDEEDDPLYEVNDEESKDEDQHSDAGLSDNGEESEDEDEVVEEDIELFNSVNYEEQIPDEDEEYPATDDSDGDEEEQAERLARRDLPDGVFSLRQLYCSGEEFKKNIIRYILNTRRNVVYDRWEITKLGARCKEKGCQWSIYCAIENPIGKWKVKRYEDEHQCHPVGRCELIKSPVIADIFLEDIRRDPEMSAPEIKDEMKRRYNLIISPVQSQTARRMAFDKLQAEIDEEFARLRDYVHELKRSNKGKTVDISTITKEDGTETFNQIYICFEAFKRSWKKSCRPVIGLDGTFLKHSVLGMLLTAIGRDPNNQIYPIAWAIVSSENNPN